MVGLTVPVIPMAHQYLVTKPIDGVTRDIPTMRDPDRLVYFREEVGGLLMGGYERTPAPWGLDGIPRDFTSQAARAGLGAVRGPDGAGDSARTARSAAPRSSP